MRLINLTPHPVTINGVTIQPAGPAPRCPTTVTPLPPLVVDGQEIPVEQVSMGQVTGLPDPVNDVALIVSRPVAEAASHRRDLYIPHKLTRDASGAVIGCAALGQVAAPAADGPDVEAVLNLCTTRADWAELDNRLAADGWAVVLVPDDSEAETYPERATEAALRQLARREGREFVITADWLGEEADTVTMRGWVVSPYRGGRDGYDMVILRTWLEGADWINGHEVNWA